MAEKITITKTYYKSESGFEFYTEFEADLFEVVHAHMDINDAEDFVSYMAKDTVALIALNDVIVRRMFDLEKNGVIVTHDSDDITIK